MVAFFSYTKLKRFEANTDDVVNISVIKYNLTEILSLLKDAETGQRGYLLTRDTIFLESYKGADKKINLLLMDLNRTISDDNNSHNELLNFKQLIEARLYILNTNLKYLQLHPNSTFNEYDLLKGKNKMDEVRKQAYLMIQKANKQLLKSIALKNHSTSDTPLSLMTIFFFSVLFSLAKTK
jgi:CHASE3 domain sensor protein